MLADIRTRPPPLSPASAAGCHPASNASELRRCRIAGPCQPFCPPHASSTRKVKTFHKHPEVILINRAPAPELPGDTHQAARMQLRAQAKRWSDSAEGREVSSIFPILVGGKVPTAFVTTRYFRRRNCKGFRRAHSGRISQLDLKQPLRWEAEVPRAIDWRS